MTLLSWLRTRLWHRLSDRFRLFLGAGLAVSLAFNAWLVPVLSQSPVELSFLISAQGVPIWQPIVEEFEAQNPDIRIKMVEGPFASNLLEDLYTSAFLLGDSPYDLVYMDIVWVPKFAAAGWLSDLSERVSADTVGQFLDGDIDGGRYNGGLYRIPARTDAGMLYYREDLLNEAGASLPETFEELKQTAAQIQETGDARWGYVWQGKQYEGVAAMFVEILAGHGGFWVDPATKTVGLDQPEAIAAVQYLQTLVRDGISPPGVTTYQEEETRRLFQGGESVFLRNWPYVWPLANGEESAVRGKIGIKPMVHAPGFESAACLGGWGWGMSSSTSHPEEAWRVIDFFTSEAVQKQVVLQAGALPTRRSLYSDAEILKEYPYFSQMLTVLESSALRPPIAQYAQASDILQRYLSAAFSGRMTAEKAMQAAANETRRLLGGAS